MRLDHIAYRTASRDKTAKFFMEAFGYKIQTEFELFFDEEKKNKAICIALEPPEKSPNLPWHMTFDNSVYHLAPEIFVSSSDVPGNIVYEWVKNRNGVGGIHHLAYQVDDVNKTMEEWKLKGYCEFSSEKPFQCEDLTQVFTKPSELTGVVYEFIQRNKHGFCKENVKDLMLSTVAKLDERIH